MSEYIIKDEEGIRKYDSCVIISKDKYKSIHGKLKIRIMEILSKKAYYIKDIADELKINEQNVYYHMREMDSILDVVAEKKVRGIVAKKYKLKANNICLNIKSDFKDRPEQIGSKNNTNLNSFFFPFISNGKLNSTIVVGSPDPHGPYKARARDGHYAADLSLFLGQFCPMPNNFSVMLDVDVKLDSVQNNLIVVGGPITNLIMTEINKIMTTKFVEEKQWAINGKKETYHDDNTGLIARLKNPYDPQKMVLVIAGLRFSGTKAAVIGLSRKTNIVLSRFTGQSEFYAIIQGFDLDGDGKIDSVELLE